MKRKISVIVLIAAVLLSGLCGCKQKNQDISVPNGFELARSEVAKCYFFYPSTVWILSEDGGYIGVVKANYGNDNSGFTVNRWEESGVIGAKDYWDGIKNENEGTFTDGEQESFGGYEQTLSQIVSDYKPIEKFSTEIGGYDAYEVTYDCSIAGTQFRIMQTTICIKKAAKTVVYELTYTSTPEYYEDNLDAVNSMIESFTPEE